MKQQEKKISQKKRGRPATGAGHPVLVRLQPNEIAALDGHRGENSRPEAIRRILTDYLKRRGMLQASEK